MLHLHSTLAIVLLLALVVSIIITLANFAGNKPYNRKIALIGLISAHLQLVVGLVLFFVLKYPSMISGSVMKDPTLRFKIIEHPLTMIIAIVLITIGYSKAKRITDAKKANKTVLIFFILGLIFILSRIPWSTWSFFV
ncbi:hypothetical protein ACR79M_06570 [Sphingobacterium spiritivorum]|uniref:hypothetical protein n=1 Tax=Sphingobacterium TaxID=28453 RepID=UPI0019193282|nr:MULTISPECIES: hypothetical protein [Sphingobacterium]QQT26640.1 hypothetical protein I6J02_01910 [Sphingobacterium spiritivorum]